MAEDHHQQQPTAAGAEAYSPEQIDQSIAFMKQILAELEAAPDVRSKLLDLLGGLGNHGGDCDAVGSRAVKLLRGHPDVLRRFIAFVGMDIPVEEGLARQTPAAAASPEPPPNVVTGTAARNQQALTFVQRVHDTAGPVVRDRFLAVLAEAERSEDMFANEIYEKAKRAFGRAHVGLLHAFATAWLPGEQEWKLQQARGRPPAAARQRSRRHAAAAASASASSLAAAGTPDAKKPRADDGNGNGRRRHDYAIAVPEARNVKKRRSDDDGTARRLHAIHRIGESSGGGGAAAHGRDDDDCDYVPRSRAKKPHSGNGGEFSGRAAAAARVVLADAATGVLHRAYSDNDKKKKPPRRRAANGGKSSRAASTAAGTKQQRERDAEQFREFRKVCESHTSYSKLVATIKRVKELLHPTRTTHGDDDGGSGGGNRSLEELFPLPICREILHNCYGGDHWGEMKVALECGESRVRALEEIERRLNTMEEEAVVEESSRRCRHDPHRVAQGLRVLGLAMDTLDVEHWQQLAGGGA